MSGIIWLASFPKSGNTWLRTFLANYILNPAAPLPINDLPKWPGCMGDARAETFMKFGGLRRDQLTSEKVAEMRGRVHMWMAYQNKPESIFVKTHTAMGFEHGKPLISPEATVGAIYVIRNPFDVAVSYSHHYQVSIDRAVESLCDVENYTPDHEHMLTEYLTSWEHHVRTWLAAKDLRLHIMRYEDMRQTPIKSFGKLMKFLNAPPDMARLKKAINFSSFDELKKQESKVRFVESRPDGKAEFFRQGKVGGWRDHLTDKHVEMLIQSGGAVMRQFGYLDKDGNLTV